MGESSRGFSFSDADYPSVGYNFLSIKLIAVLVCLPSFRISSILDTTFPLPQGSAQLLREAVLEEVFLYAEY